MTAQSQADSYRLRLSPTAMLRPFAQSREQPMILLDPQRLDILVKAVEALPPRCLGVLILRKVEHLRVEEIVLRLGVGRNIVDKHLRKALLACQAKLIQPGTAAVRRACERAAEWTLRVDAGGCSEMEWRELERWLSDSSAHRAAFEGAYRSWIELDEITREVDLRAYAHSVSRHSRGEGACWRGVAVRLRLLGRRWFGRRQFPRSSP